MRGYFRGDPASMRALATWVQHELSVPEVVVHSAGIGMTGSFFDTSDADWEQILRVNLGGVILGSRLFGQQMLDAGQRGHLVNVASMAAYTPSRSMAAYATTKAAVRMLSDCLRAELADQGVQVSTICPGLSITNLRPEAIAHSILACVEQGRAEAPVGVEAHAARFLARASPATTRWLATVALGA